MRFEHGDVGFDYDPDDCDEFITATAWARQTFDFLEAMYDPTYVAKYLAMWLPRLVSPKVLEELARLLTPGWTLTKTAGVVKDPGPVLGT